MRCVCGRFYPNHWRDILAVLVAVIVFASMLRAERERRAYQQARAELVKIGVMAQTFMDSVRATRTRGTN